MREEIFRIESVTKCVDDVTLLDNFNLRIYKGEIMGLLPLNTHGKDALVELLCQNTPISHGRIYYNDGLLSYFEPTTRNRTYIIEKTSKLSKNLTVAENIFVLRKGFKKYVINYRVLNSQALQFINELGVSINPAELVANLSPFECCVVELLKAVATGAKLVVLNEISSFLSSVDLVRFYEIMHYYCKKELSFLYIGNHHEEAFKICDRTALMRNGRILKILQKDEFKTQKLLPYIFGFCDAAFQVRKEFPPQTLLQFKDVYTENLKGMSFTVKKGECVVILDMNNTATLSDILQLMNGQQDASQGSIAYTDRDYARNQAQQALENGICFVAENPTETMLYKHISYLDNLCFLLDRKIPSRLRRRVKQSVIKEYRDLIGDDIYASDITNLELRSLYNLVYYRLHIYRPKVVFCVQPFSGADMYLRHHVIYLLNQLKQKGVSIVLLAVNISDSLVLADRLLLVSKGKLVREYEASDFGKIDADIFAD
ncbi:ATP-binding cassette domain-containing protein [Oscillospiraceae bacterium PP1C4]